MMWNWLVGALSVGATIVLYDGSPFQPHHYSMWELAEQLGITVFGTRHVILVPLAVPSVRTCTGNDDLGIGKMRACLWPNC
jgi:acetoacetyl-CoA synthetase